MSQKAKLIFSTHEVTIASRWMIPSNVTEYLDEACVLALSDGTRISIPDPVQCQACFQPFEDATYETKVFSRISELNLAIGYIAKICVDCAWYVEYRRGNTANIPRSIRSKLESGHCMRLQHYGLDEQDVLCYNLD